MFSNFQHEIPKARINITLDLLTDGARKRKELPLKLLVLGDFTQGKPQGLLADRERINIDKTNFDAVLSNLAPEITCVLPNHINKNSGELLATLKFDALKKFHPDELVKQVPELSNLLAMRNLLKDLKANLIDNLTLRRELEKIMKNTAQLQALKQQLNEITKDDLCKQ